MENKRLPGHSSKAPTLCDLLPGITLVLIFCIKIIRIFVHFSSYFVVVVIWCWVLGKGPSSTLLGATSSALCHESLMADIAMWYK